jgi:hypothetical protein
MPAVKTYTRVNFQNYPSTSTPLNATNLNKLDKGIDDLDDEVVTVKNAIENMSFDADAISYNNTQSGLQATDVQGAVDEINDNLSGFKYYPIGTAIVGLVADDSAYTDANGNYILADSATGRGLIDNITYKSISSTEKTYGEVGADTCSPFKSKLNPINPSKQLSRYIIRAGSTGTTFDNCWNSGCMMSILGYKQFHIYANANQYIGDGFCFRFLDESLNVVGSYYNFSGGSWRSYDIPSNAVYVEAGLKYASHSPDYEPYYYSLN